MFDRAAFLRPIAHRGLHEASRGVIENSGPAFEAAIAGGFGIECDVQPARDGSPVVFHDAELARLVEAPGLVSDHPPDVLAGLRYRGDASTRILRLSEMLALVAGRVPLLIEVKTAWSAPDPRFVAAIARDLAPYRGPCAIMSFDPAIVAAIKPFLPNVPRGIVSGVYTPDWSRGRLDDERAWRLTHLLESAPAAPSFFAYDVKALPTPVTRFLREGLGMPLFTWTVRNAEDLTTARSWADAPIFESVDPRM